MVKKLFLMLVVALFCSSFISFGQNTDKTVTLVVSGEGLTKEDATKNALRSAIEQAFGTFVSANTEVVNDELIKDEIVSVTTGNVQKYTEISYLDSNDDYKCITLEVVVSIDKLQSFAQSHGVSAELSGATFAMNVKLQKLNIQSEETALNNLAIQVEKMMDGCQIFDLDLVVEEPSYDSKSNNYWVSGHLNMIPNKNFFEINEYIQKTLLALSLKNDEIEDFIKFGYTPSYLGGRYIIRVDDSEEAKNSLMEKYVPIIREKQLSSESTNSVNNLKQKQSNDRTEYRRNNRIVSAIENDPRIQSFNSIENQRYRNTPVQSRRDVRTEIENRNYQKPVTWDNVANYLVNDLGYNIKNIDEIEYPFIFLRSKNVDAFIRIYRAFLRQTINFEIKNNLGDYANFKYEEFISQKNIKSDLRKEYRIYPLIQNAKDEWVNFDVEGSITLSQYWRYFAFDQYGRGYTKSNAKYLLYDVAFAPMLCDNSVLELGRANKPMVSLQFSKKYSDEEIVKLTGFEANYKKIEFPTK